MVSPSHLNHRNTLKFVLDTKPAKPCHHGCSGSIPVPAQRSGPGWRGQAGDCHHRSGGRLRLHGHGLEGGCSSPDLRPHAGTSQGTGQAAEASSQKSAWIPNRKAPVFLCPHSLCSCSFPQPSCTRPFPWTGATASELRVITWSAWPPTELPALDSRVHLGTCTCHQCPPPLHLCGMHVFCASLDPSVEPAHGRLSTNIYCINLNIPETLQHPGQSQSPQNAC